MSKKLLKQRLYTEHDIKNAGTRIERLYMFMMSPELKISNRDREYYDNLKTTFAIISGEVSNTRAIKKVRAAFPDIKCDGTIYNMVNDCRELFGNVIKRNIEFDRNVLIEKFWNIYNKCIKAGELKEARLSLANIAKLKGADIHEASKLDPDDIRLPDITWTSDPSVLNAEDIDFEEIPKLDQ